MRNTLGVQTHTSHHRPFDADIATGFGDFRCRHEVQDARREKFNQFLPIRKFVLDTFEVTTAMALPVGEIGSTDEIATLGASKITPAAAPPAAICPVPRNFTRPRNSAFSRPVPPHAQTEWIPQIRQDTESAKPHNGPGTCHARHVSY